MTAQSDAVVAAADLGARSGATDFEIGYLHDDVPVEEAGWWAKANYRGHRLYVDDQPSPAHAADALAALILEGGFCTGCFRQVTVKPWTKSDKRRCKWYRWNDEWRRGCDGKGRATRR